MHFLVHMFFDIIKSPENPAFTNNTGIFRGFSFMEHMGFEPT